MTGRRGGGRSGRRAGFTLVEVLAALAILAALGAVVTRGLVVARTGTLATDGYMGAEAVARTLMEGPVPLAIRRPGSFSGTLEGRRYEMTSEAIDIPLPKRGADEPPRPEPAFVPLRVTVRVSAGEAREVRVQTVRLVPREAAR